MGIQILKKIIQRYSHSCKRTSSGYGCVMLVSVHPERLVANQNDFKIGVYRLERLSLRHSSATTIPLATYLADNDRYFWFKVGDGKQSRNWSQNTFWYILFLKIHILSLQHLQTSVLAPNNSETDCSMEIISFYKVTEKKIRAPWLVK